MLINRKNSITFISLVTLSLFGLVSCATVARGGKSEIYITSDPSNLDIEITEINTGELVFSGKTPKAIVLSKKSGFFKGAIYDIKASYPELEPVQVRIAADKLNIRNYIVGNTFSGLFVGWFLVDPLTGAMYEWTKAYVSEGDGKVSGIVTKKDGSLKITHRSAVQKVAEEATDLDTFR